MARRRRPSLRRGAISARAASATEAAARTAFEKLGDTSLALDRFTLHNPAGLFVPVSRLNQLRRDLVEGLETALREQQLGPILAIACLLEEMGYQPEQRTQQRGGEHGCRRDPREPCRDIQRGRCRDA